MKLWMRFAASLAAVFALGAQAQQNLSIATGGTGGVYYPLGGGMAAVLSKYVGIQSTAEVTGGSVANLQLINTGKPYIALTMADALKDAYKGEDKFKGKPVAVRTLMVLYPNRMQAVTIDGNGISKISDLKGKRISTGSAGSATEVMAFRLLEAAGIDKDRDITRERLGAAESANALKDRKIDAFFFVAGIPTSAITDVANTPGIKIKMIDHADLVPAMNKKHGELYVADSIPKETYRGMEKDNAQASVMNLLVAPANMSDKEAHDIVKAIFDHKDELVRVHKEAENFRLENQKKEASPIPWHPGAVKYFAEKGIKLQ